MAANNKITDIEDIVIRWAQKMFKTTRSKDQAKLAADDLNFNVSWQRVKTVHKEPEYAEVTKPSEPKSNVLFKTTFTNNTDHEQEYSFKTERTTRSTCEVEIEKGVSYGQELGLSLKLPGDVVEIGAGFNREVSVTHTVQQSYEEELVWGVDSLVKVRPKHKTTAELTIKEDQFHSSFTVKTNLSGKVLVTVTNKKDNNSFLKVIEGDISDIVKHELADNNYDGLSVNKHKVSYITKGKCHMRYGIEQNVQLTEDSI